MKIPNASELCIIYLSCGMSLRWFLLDALLFVLTCSATVTEIPLSDRVHSPHLIVPVAPAGSEFLTLQFLGSKASALDFYVVNSTGTGKLFQLARNYIKHGYDPKNGEKITIGNMLPGEKKLASSVTSKAPSKSPVLVEDPKQRVFYKRPEPDRSPVNSRYGTVDYVVVRKSDGYRSEIGTIFVVPSSHALVGSDFSFFSASKLSPSELVDGWTIIGNHHVLSGVAGEVRAVASSLPAFERYRLGALHNHYIVGIEDAIDIATAGGSDRQLWYFQAPSKFLGNYGVAYGGYLSFSLTAISGDFSRMNDLSRLNLVELECAECDGVHRKGIKLVYRVSQWSHSFLGPAQNIRIHLFENAGWLKDSQDSLIPWRKPSKCEMLMVLGRLSSVRILGDFTQGFETIALDDVRISNSNGTISVDYMTKLTIII